jgi:hypothetical protein
VPEVPSVPLVPACAIKPQLKLVSGEEPPEGIVVVATYELPL